MDAAADTAGIGCGLYRSRFPESARQLHGSRLKGFHHRADGPHAISIHAACLVVAWGGRIFGIPGRHIDLVRLLTRVGAFLIACVMLTAIASVHWPSGFFAGKGGYEYPLALLAMCLALLI